MSLKEKINKLKEKENLARSAGGSEQIEKQHGRGKLTARERIDLLLDPEVSSNRKCLSRINPPNSA